MSVKEAIQIFRKKYKDKVVGYTRYQGHIVLITEFDGTLKSNHYIIIDKDKIMPTNPMIIDLDEKRVIKL